MSDNNTPKRTIKMDVLVADKLKSLVPGGKKNTYSTVVDQLVDVAEVLKPHMKDGETYAQAAQRFIGLVMNKPRTNKFKR